MKIIENIKRKSGLSALNKSLKAFKRNKFVHNLVTARTIGIVGIVNDTNDFDKIINLKRYFDELNQDVLVMAHFPGKEVPQQLLLRRGINIFNKNEVNWYGKPMVAYVDEFCNKEFDILIDLSRGEIFPIHWIMSLSKAHFKVGSLNYTNNPYDLIITIEEDRDMDYLIEQIKHYLYLLNNRIAQEEDNLSDSQTEEAEEISK